MKKFMKRCAVIAFIFAVLGCVLGALGSSIAGRTKISRVVEKVTGGTIHMGSGSWWDWDNAGKEIADNIENVFDIDVDYDIDDASKFDRDFDIMSGDVDRYCPGSGARKLEIEVGGCQLETRISEDGDIYLEAENAHKFQGYIKGNTLYIRSVTGSVKEWMDISSHKIILYVPEDYQFDEVKIDVGAGELRYDNMKARDAELEVGAGRIVLDHAFVTELDLSVGAGAIELNDMRITKLDAEVGMGEVLLDGMIDGDVSVECSMGNVEMTLEDREEEFNYRLSGAMGNITLGESSFSGFSSERKIDNHAGKDMEIECSMGNITIDFRN